MLDCVDVKAATTKTYANVDVERKFKLAGDRQSMTLYSEKDMITVSGSMPNSKGSTTHVTMSGSSTAGNRTGSITGAYTTYNIDVAYFKSYSIDQLDPTHWYKLQFVYDFAMKNGANHNDLVGVSRNNWEAFLLVGGKEYSFGADKSPTIFIEKNASSKVTLKIVDHLIITVENSFTATFDRIMTFSGVKTVLTDLGKQTGTIESKLNNIDNTSKDQLAEAKKQTDESKKQTEESKKQTGIMSGLLNKITTFFNNFFSGLINALVSVFVPEDGYFKDYFDRLNKFFSDKLGMLYTPIDMFVKLLNGIKGASGTDMGIVFPGLKWEDTYIIPKQTISLSAYSKQVPEIQQKIYFVTDIIMVGAVLLLLQNKLKEVLTQ